MEISDFFLQKEWLTKEQGRLLMYDFLTTIFSYPHQDLIHYLQDPQFIDDLSWALPSIKKECTEPIQSIASLMSGKKDSHKALEDLSIEYTRLFINSYEGCLAPPYESVYMDTERRVMGSCVVKVAALYEYYGFEICKEYSEPPDHIVFEMAFMKQLIGKEIHQLTTIHDMVLIQQYIEGQKLFLTEHLGRFAPNFFHDIMHRSKDPVWQGIAHIGTLFLREETSYPDGAPRTRGGMAQ
ncbi:MAG: molecular chaperone [bacterium]